MKCQNETIDELECHQAIKGEFQSPSADSGLPKAPSESPPITNALTPLSESLRASLSALSDDALSILGPELFEQANKELNRSPQMRAENNRNGTLFNAIDGYMRFFYRDEKSRARHMYENVVGLVYPCSKTDAEKRRLVQAFEDGWESGELEFLASVPKEDLGLYGGTLSSENFCKEAVGS